MKYYSKRNPYRIVRRAAQETRRPTRNRVGLKKHATGTRTKTKDQLIACRSVTKISFFNVRTLSNDKNLFKLVHNAQQQNITVICIQDHRNYHPDIEVNHKMIGNDWQLITCSAEKNRQNASVDGVGFLINPQAYKSVTKITKINSQIIKATIDGNPMTTVTSCYSTTNACEEQQRQDFYTSLSECTRAIPKHNISIIGGDMNAKVCPADCKGNSFNRKTNANGQALLSLLDECDLAVTNTRFRKRNGKLWTFTYPNGKKAQLDYILVNKKWQNTVRNCEAYNTFCLIGSDHRIVTAELKLKLKLRATKNLKKKTKYNWNCLIKDKDIKEKYNIEVRNRFEVLNTEDNIQSADSIYQSIVAAHAAATESVISKLQKVETKRQIAIKAQKAHFNKSTKRTKDTVNKALADLKLLYETIKREFVETKINEINSAHIQKKAELAWNTAKEVSN